MRAPIALAAAVLAAASTPARAAAPMRVVLLRSPLSDAVTTDAMARVLSQDGEPIENLYAVGEMTGLYYGNYTGSTSVLRGMVFGRIAGEKAAERRAALAH